MGQQSASARKLVVGKVYVIGDRLWLSVVLQAGERLVSLRPTGVEIRELCDEAKELRENHPSVEDLCACWQISVPQLDAWIVEHVYTWRAEWRAGIARGVGRGWTNCLDRGEARGRLFGLDLG